MWGFFLPVKKEIETEKELKSLPQAVGTANCNSTLVYLSCKKQQSFAAITLLLCITKIAFLLAPKHLCVSLQQINTLTLKQPSCPSNIYNEIWSPAGFHFINSLSLEKT